MRPIYDMRYARLVRATLASTAQEARQHMALLAIASEASAERRDPDRAEYEDAIGSVVSFLYGRFGVAIFA
jgi:hypothetical protein